MIIIRSLSLLSPPPFTQTECYFYRSLSCLQCSTWRSGEWLVCAGNHHCTYHSPTHNCSNIKEERCVQVQVLVVYTLISHVATGKAVISDETEIVYEEPDLSQLKEQKKGIKLEKCPAYRTAKKDQDIELEECPAYGTSKKDQNIELEDLSLIHI